MDEKNLNTSLIEEKDQEEAEVLVNGKDELAESPKSVRNESRSSGWGGWGGFSALSVFSDLQKAAEEISRNATAVAEKAARTLVAEDDNPSEKLEDGRVSDQDNEDEKDNKRKVALDKLEQASSDTLLGQGLKAIDNSVESLAFGAWEAFGNAWKGGSSLVQKIENSAANLAESFQQGSLPGTAPALLETGKNITKKGIQVLEYVGKETMDLLISETGIEIENNAENPGYVADKDHLVEEVTFDRCFYIYGGPEQLEELEALSNHHALLFNRRKVKLSVEQRSIYDGKLKLIQQILTLSTDEDTHLNKGKNIETDSESNDEIKILYDSGVKKVADMASGFASALSGLAANDIIQKSTSRIDSLHSEGVHRLSEMCCSSVAQLFFLGKSLISATSNAQDEEIQEGSLTISWPEDSEDKAKVIRMKVLSMSGYLEAVANNFSTGIYEVSSACAAALSTTPSDGQEASREDTVSEKAKSLAELLRSDAATSLGKVQEGLQYLSYVLISTSMPSS